MIGKKDTFCIFEQYRNVLKEQVDDRVKALLSAIAISDLDDEFKKGLSTLLSDPEVASKWKGGAVKSINDGDPRFAKEMSELKKATQDNRSGKELQGEYPAFDPANLGQDGGY